MRAFVLCIVASLALSACSSSSSPAPAPTPKPGLSVDNQRLAAQAAIVTANGIEVASTLAAVLNALLAGGQSSATGPGPCNNGVRITKDQLSSAKFRVTIDAYYDPKCATIFSDAVLTVTLTSASSFDISGLMYTHDPAGKVVAYATLTNQTKLASTTTSVTQGNIRVKNGPSAQYGLSCSLATNNTCGFGGVVPIPSLKQSLGFVSSLQNFVASGSSKNGVVNATAYTGATDTLKLHQGSGTSWKISGGSRAGVLSGTFKEKVDAKALDVDGSVLLNTAGKPGVIDDGQAATTAVSFGTRSGIAQGTVRQTSSGKRFATFSTDAVGSGAIDYSSGSTGTIAFFIVAS